ncbi:MAG TPA: hypothetical protein VK395_22160 [Gemmataceae bacterium]|nr:hypothetical protein [Gemmataceae bacterium]
MAKFSKETTERIASALGKKNINGRCPMCHDGLLKIVDGFFVPRIVHGLVEVHLTFGGEQTIYPCVGITCETCGYTALFSLAVLGLADLFQEGGKNA